jgi:hypothetical protein
LPPSHLLDVILIVLASGVGFVGIAWYRCGRGRNRASWGRRLFLATLLALGGVSLVAAWRSPGVLLFLGLAVAALVIGMLWEGPAKEPARHRLPGEA